MRKIYISPFMKTSVTLVIILIPIFFLTLLITQFRTKIHDNKIFQVLQLTINV